MKKLLIFSVLAVLAGVVIVTQTTLLQSPQVVQAENVTISQLRDKAVQYILDTWGAGNATSYANSIRSDGTWADINYAAGSSNEALTHADRVFDMAIALRKGNSSVKSAIERALTYIDSDAALRACTGPRYTCAWATYKIGMTYSRSLGRAMVLLRGQISSSAFNAGLHSLETHVIGISSSGRSNYNAQSTLTNFYTALAADDSSLLNSVRTTVGSITLPNGYISNTRRIGSEGLKPDYSYLDHSATPYISGYGSGEFAGNIAEYIYLTNGTQYAIPSGSLESFASYVSEGILWNIYKGYWNPSVMGRGITRGLDGGIGGVRTVAQLMSSVSSSKRSQISAGVTANISGHKVFPYADLTVHRRSNFFMSIKSISNRSLTSDVVGGENAKAAVASNGMMHLVMTGNEYANDVLPTLDWARLPGVTVEKKPNVERLRGQSSGNPDGPSGAGWPGEKGFVGGTSDGTNGVSVMDFGDPFTPLTAHKAWFFFDDYAVFTTDQIHDSSGYAVETVVDQRPSTGGGTSPIVVNGATQSAGSSWSSTLSNVSWVAANNVGYYFPERETLQAKRESRSGTWEDMGALYNDSDVHRANIFTLWKNHGSNPSNASLVYAVVPDKNGSSMSSWVSQKQNSLRVLRMDDQVTAVEDTSKGLMGIVFWRSGASVKGTQFPAVSADSPSVVLLKKSGNTIEVSASDPSNWIGSMHLTFSGDGGASFQGDGVHVDSQTGSVTVVSVPRFNLTTSGWEVTPGDELPGDSTPPQPVILDRTCKCSITSIFRLLRSDTIMGAYSCSEFNPSENKAFIARKTSQGTSLLEFGSNFFITTSVGVFQDTSSGETTYSIGCVEDSEDL